MRLIRAIGVFTWEGVAFMAAFTSSSAIRKHHCVQAVLLHVGANLHDGALESCPPIKSAKRRRVNGRDA
eukprot:2103336-Pleurochrysis_carterae.AAC.1